LRAICSGGKLLEYYDDWHDYDGMYIDEVDLTEEEKKDWPYVGTRWIIVTGLFEKEFTVCFSYTLTEFIIKRAIRNNPDSLYLLPYLNENICIAAIEAEQNPETLSKIPQKYKTEKVITAALEINGLSLRYVDDKTYEQCLTAVESNKDALQFVPPKFITEELIKLALSDYLKYLPEGVTLSGPSREIQ
jgi:hypothetical protein